MAGIKKSKLNELKKALQARLAELLGDIEKASKELPEEHREQFADPTDQAVSELDRARFLRFKDRESKLIKKIEKALNRIEDGTYGECDMCGASIDLVRLEARPMADLCIDCATEVENEKKRLQRDSSGPSAMA